jgi:glutamyl-Q tRNA(Asp) synthetase
MTSPRLDDAGALPAQPVTRFAPSPTGLLHLGHAFAALTAFALARRGGGRFLLRIEDIDGARCREEFVAALYEDLAWLGIGWEEPVLRQSLRMAAYAGALARLGARGLTYPCFCSRASIAAEIARAAAAPQGPEGPVYPGLCRELGEPARQARIAAGHPYVVRLDMARALAQLSAPLSFAEHGRGPGGETGRIGADPAPHGDIVLARKDTPASYHLCVALDDAHQGVSLVTRGEDLFAATALHRLLQTLLGLPEPAYHHHRLIRDETGRRLAKRDRAQTLRRLREEDVSPAAIRENLGL